MTAAGARIIPGNWLWRARRALNRLAGASAAPLFLGGFVLAIRAALIPVWPIPLPTVTDEFSYLLLGRTFAAGRLANPSHPLWRHFETLFVLSRPVYASVYPIAQGLFLALGISVANEPWWGVWLSGGLMCAAIAWMLRGWMPPSWAFLGACLAALQIGILGPWMNSFWGGCPAAIGGALVFGALPRMERRRRASDALIFGAGLAILANSRPYEGLAVSLPAAVWLAGVWRRRPETARKQVLPLLFLLAMVAAADGYYFRRITGSPFQTPYQPYIEQYAAAPAFVWQSEPSQPVYRHDILRDAHLAFRIDYRQARTIGGFLRLSFGKLARLAAFYLGPLWLIPALSLPCLLRIPRIRILLICAAAGLMGMLMAVPFWPHYVAPMAGIIFALLAESLRILWLMRRRGIIFGVYVAAAAPIACLFTALFSLNSGNPQSRLTARPAVIRSLEQMGQAHLVFVRYGRDHALGEEWVYNDPDIDGARIVWARDMGPRNEELRRYFPRRVCWFLDPDQDPVRLSAYKEPWFHSITALPHRSHRE